MTALSQLGQLQTIIENIPMVPNTLASIAKQEQILINVFSDALGHDSEKTTLIYLSTLDTSAVDKANSDISAAFAEW